MKQGYKTTEFWLALVAQVISILVIVGVLTSGEANNLAEAITNAAAAVAALVAAIAPVVKYIESRTRVKEAENAVITVIKELSDDE